MNKENEEGLRGLLSLSLSALKNSYLFGQTPPPLNFHPHPHVVVYFICLVLFESRSPVAQVGFTLPCVAKEDLWVISLP